MGVIVARVTQFLHGWYAYDPGQLHDATKNAQRIANMTGEPQNVYTIDRNTLEMQLHTVCEPDPRAMEALGTYERRVQG